MTRGALTSGRRPPRRAFLAATAVGILTLLGTTGGCGGGKPPEPARPPASVRPKTPTSLVLVDLSGVRYDEVSPPGDAGASPSALPTFRALATEGTFFTQAVSPAPWDLPAVVGLLTGNLPSECAVRGRPGDGQNLIPAVETLAETLAEGGYATAGFTAGGRIASAARLSDGFGTWREIPDDAARLEAAKSWLATLAPDRPRFLFLHAAVGAPAGATRAQRLAELDAWLRDARALAKGVATKDGAWFVALSDHGDVLSEREGVAATGEANVLDAQLRVPLVAIGPGFAPGRRDESVGLVDVVPTVRDRIGLGPWPTNDGRSLGPLLDGKTPGGRPVRSEAWLLVSTPEGRTVMHLHAVRLPTAKYVAAYDESTGKWEAALFDLVADPTETKPGPADDLARLGPEFVAIVERIRKELKGGEELHADKIAGPYFARPGR